MELWIRSQDRTMLIPKPMLWISDNEIWMEVPFYENHKKLGLCLCGNNHKLATYKTKERALEVLDEIQDIIGFKKGVLGFKKGVFGNIVSKFNYNNFFTYLYEMPEE